MPYQSLCSDSSATTTTTSAVIAPPPLTLNDAKLNVSGYFDACLSGPYSHFVHRKQHLALEEEQRQQSSVTAALRRSSPAVPPAVLPDARLSASTARQETIALTQCIHAAEHDTSQEQQELQAKLWQLHADKPLGGGGGQHGFSSQSPASASSTYVNPGNFASLRRRSLPDLILAGSEPGQNHNSSSSRQQSPLFLSSTTLDFGGGASSSGVMSGSGNSASAAMASSFGRVPGRGGRRASLVGFALEPNEEGGPASATTAGRSASPASPLAAPPQQQQQQQQQQHQPPASRSPKPTSLGNVFSGSPAMKQSAARHAASALFHALSVAVAYDIDLQSAPGTSNINSSSAGKSVSSAGSAGMTDPQLQQRQQRHQHHHHHVAESVGAHILEVYDTSFNHHSGGAAAAAAAGAGAASSSTSSHPVTALCTTGSVHTSPGTSRTSYPSMRVSSGVASTASAQQQLRTLGPFSMPPPAPATNNSGGPSAATGSFLFADIPRVPTPEHQRRTSSSSSSSAAGNAYRQQLRQENSVRARTAFLRSLGSVSEAHIAQKLHLQLGMREASLPGGALAAAPARHRSGSLSSVGYSSSSHNIIVTAPSPRRSTITPAEATSGLGSDVVMVTSRRDSLSAVDIANQLQQQQQQQQRGATEGASSVADERPPELLRKQTAPPPWAPAAGHVANNNNSNNKNSNQVSSENTCDGDGGNTTSSELFDQSVPQSLANSGRMSTVVHDTQLRARNPFLSMLGSKTRASPNNNNNDTESHCRQSSGGGASSSAASSAVLPMMGVQQQQQRGLTSAAGGVSPDHLSFSQRSNGTTAALAGSSRPNIFLLLSSTSGSVSSQSMNATDPRINNSSRNSGNNIVGGGGGGGARRQSSGALFNLTLPASDSEDNLWDGQQRSGAQTPPAMVHSVTSYTSEHSAPVTGGGGGVGGRNSAGGGTANSSHQFPNIPSMGGISELGDTVESVHGDVGDMSHQYHYPQHGHLHHEVGHMMQVSPINPNRSSTSMSQGTHNSAGTPTGTTASASVASFGGTNVFLVAPPAAAVRRRGSAATNSSVPSPAATPNRPPILPQQQQQQPSNSILAQVGTLRPPLAAIGGGAATSSIHSGGQSSSDVSRGHSRSSSALPPMQVSPFEQARQFMQRPVAGPPNSGILSELSSFSRLPGGVVAVDSSVSDSSAQQQQQQQQHHRQQPSSPGQGEQQQQQQQPKHQNQEDDAKEEQEEDGDESPRPRDHTMVSDDGDASGGAGGGDEEQQRSGSMTHSSQPREVSTGDVSNSSIVGFALPPAITGAETVASSHSYNHDAEDGDLGQS